MAKIPFIGQTYSGRSTNINAQRCINWYPEIDRSEGKNVRSLIPTPGTVLQANLGSSSIRGMHVVRSGITTGERLFVVAGNTLWELDESYTATNRGTLSSSTGLVSMADNGEDNGDQLLITDGIYKNASAFGYIFNLDTNTLTQISDVDFPNPTECTFLDSYFVVCEQNSGRFYVSDLLNGTSWDGTKFATAESNPDNLVSIINDHRELWLFGEVSTEVWENIGDPDFPFSRIPGAVMEWGCAAQKSVAKADNAVFWLGQNNLGNAHVLMARGFQAEVISTPAIEHQLGKYTTYSDAQAFTYQMEGHSFYVLTFPIENATWVFDISTGMWHERSWSGLDNRWYAETYVFYNGNHLVGDYRTGNIYKLDLDVYTDDGNTIHRMRRAQIISDDLQRLYHYRLQIDFESGVGIPEGQGENPKAMLRYSDDGGHKWSSERTESIGEIGEYDQRVVWRRLGSARQRIYELKVTDPVNAVVIAAHLRAGGGAS